MSTSSTRWRCSRSWSQKSPDEHERLLAIEERILQELDIPYRVVDIAAGDLGPSAARKFDCEAWIPSQERYREVTSTSNTTDYQARRLDCRYRPEPEAQPQHVHTLNGTAVAVPRRSSRCWRTASAPTARSSCRRRWSAAARDGPADLSSCGSRSSEQELMQ